MLEKTARKDYLSKQKLFFYYIDNIGFYCQVYFEIDDFNNIWRDRPLDTFQGV